MLLESCPTRGDALARTSWPWPDGFIHASAHVSMLNSDSGRASLIRIGVELDFHITTYISVLHPQQNSSLSLIAQPSAYTGETRAPPLGHTEDRARVRRHAMAAPTQTSPLRRWKRFLRAFDSVDAAIKPSDPDHLRDELRRARGDIVEQLCDAEDDDQAERLCGILDDHMAESLETLRQIPVMPDMLVSTDLAKCVRALRRHESERVRVLAVGIVTGWRASMQDELAKVRDALHKLDNIDMPQTKEVAVDQQPHVSAYSDIAMKTVGIIKKASPAGDRAGLCSEEKMAAAKRKFRQAYQEAEDAKRQRRTQLVQAPKMTMQPAPIRRCTSSMVKKTFSIRSQLHMA